MSLAGNLISLKSLICITEKETFNGLASSSVSKRWIYGEKN